MKRTIKLTLVFFAILMGVPEPVDAVLGVRRRTRRRTAVVVGTSVHAADMAAMSQQQQSATTQQQSATTQQQSATTQQQSATTQQQSETAQHQSATAQQQAPQPPPTAAPAATGQKLPVGTVVTALPAGAVATPVNGVEYYYSGGNFYRAVFQGNQLVYVTAEPK